MSFDLDKWKETYELVGDVKLPNRSSTVFLTDPQQIGMNSGGSARLRGHKAWFRRHDDVYFVTLQLGTGDTLYIETPAAVELVDYLRSALAAIAVDQFEQSSGIADVPDDAPAA